MIVLPLASFTSALFGTLLAVMAVFMILLVLVQRGRGGGLAGVLGGMGGSSAFGAKAGDIFTRITAISALVWIVLCIAAARFGGSTTSRLEVNGAPRSTRTSTTGETVPAPEPKVKETPAGTSTAAEPAAEKSAASPATEETSASAEEKAPAGDAPK